MRSLQYQIADSCRRNATTTISNGYARARWTRLHATYVFHHPPTSLSSCLRHKSPLILPAAPGGRGMPFPPFPPAGGPGPNGPPMNMPFPPPGGMPPQGFMPPPNFQMPPQMGPGPGMQGMGQSMSPPQGGGPFGPPGGGR